MRNPPRCPELKQWLTEREVALPGSDRGGSKTDCIISGPGPARSEEGVLRPFTEQAHVQMCEEEYARSRQV